MDRDDEPKVSETGQNTIITQREIKPEKSKEPPDIMNPESQPWYNTKYYW